MDERDISFNESRLDWRYTYENPRLGPFDYRVIVLFLPYLMYIRLWTTLILLSCLATMYVLQKYRVTLDNLFFWLRRRAMGDVRTEHGSRNLRPAVDYGFEGERDMTRWRRILDRQRNPHKKSRVLVVPDGLKTSGLPIEKRFTTTRSS